MLTISFLERERKVKSPENEVEDRCFQFVLFFSIFDHFWPCLIKRFYNLLVWSRIIISWFGMFLLWRCLINSKTIIWRISLRQRLRYKIKTSNGIKLWKTLTCICTLIPPYCVFVLFFQQFFKLKKQVFHAVWWHVLQVRLRVEFKFYSACLYMWFFSFFFCSWNIGPAHIISISTEFYFFYREYGSEQIANQYKWLEADLKVKIVFFRVF